jgi:sugar (pentulose or hexulose) kinase
MQDLLAVLDVGKTNSKLSIVDVSTGVIVRVIQRVNRAIHAFGMNQLDIEGLNTWLVTTLAALPERASISAFVPVGHGAACILLGANGELLAAPDYEDPCFNKIAGVYELLREPYGMTYSPRLPDGQNLGAQLFYLESEQSEVFAATHQILLLPQYWAWRLCGVAATEVSSLGAHTDLWLPEHCEYSMMARSRGWRARMPPMRAANEVLGSLNSEISQATGMSAECKIFCGAHDSNMSWLSHRNKIEANASLTVISSGTWTIAMKGGAKLECLTASRDMLANVDVFGSPIATARFMGGREYAAIAGDNSASPTLEDLRHVISIGAMAWPSFSSAGGPFQGRAGAISGGDGMSPAERSALATLYVVLVTEVMLGLLGDSDVVVVDGPLASNRAFSSLLQILCPTTSVVVSRVSSGATEGARALVLGDRMRETTNCFSQAEILPLAGLQQYRNIWRSSIGMA